MNSFTFSSGRDFSIALNMNHEFRGNFIINKNDILIETPFIGIALETINHYDFSFIINWEHIKDPYIKCYTAFTGEINYGSIIPPSLFLKWLLICENTLAPSLSYMRNGTSTLFNRSNGLSQDFEETKLPFPNQTILQTT
ncbi:hypothetical protein [Fulvivirga imtechensis]|uniref:hypothetical protein n=1 Tax=Fulvivirga imtechensis TaxID=881893 RepID=UPI00058FDADC|nr:hypothetical protein [Fulvivirga imtechensis]